MSTRRISRQANIALTGVLGLGLAGRQVNAQGPCDIYASGGTPCVAAHSTVRALYSNYTGNLYQVTRGSDNTTVDIAPSSAGGVAQSSDQDSFCQGTTCLITKIYDQSGNSNDLTAAPPGGAASGPEPGGYDFVASAVGAPVTLNGQKAYGIFSTLATGYRKDDTTGIATGNDAEGIYAVLDGTHYNSGCCFDYGNAETNDKDNGITHMETVYFGSINGTAKGSGNGPWVQADLENGIWAGNQSHGVNPNNPTIDYRFVTAIVKGQDYDQWAIRGGNAQNGDLSTFYSGPRPPGYYPMNKEGAIILGIGGDNSDSAQGTFYEGAMTKGYPSDDTEAQVQQNIASQNYDTSSLISGPSISVNSNVQFKTVGGNGSDMYIGHTGNNVSLTSTSGDATTFTVRPGNDNSNCYSFESTDQLGTFLRHFAYKVYCDPSDSSRSPGTFDGDSTFCPQDGFSGDGSTAFRSFTFPTRFWRSIDDGEIYIGSNGGPLAWDDASTFDQQASWSVSSS